MFIPCLTVLNSKNVSCEDFFKKGETKIYILLDGT